MAYEPTEWARGTKITAQKLNNIERGVESVNSEYTPTTWAEGDIVTATKLNNIEQGIANASGGGGDFSTAEVTIKFGANIGDASITLPVTMEMTGIAGAAAFSLSTLSGAPATEEVVTAILFKNTCFGQCLTSGDVIVNTEGDITYSNGTLIITGDGTIEVISNT